MTWAVITTNKLIMTLAGNQFYSHRHNNVTFLLTLRSGTEKTSSIILYVRFASGTAELRATCTSGAYYCINIVIWIRACSKGCHSLMTRPTTTKASNCYHGSLLNLSWVFNILNSKLDALLEQLSPNMATE